MPGGVRVRPVAPRAAELPVSSSAVLAAPTAAAHEGATSGPPAAELLLASTPQGAACGRQSRVPGQARTEPAGTSIAVGGRAPAGPGPCPVTSVSARGPRADGRRWGEGVRELSRLVLAGAASFPVRMKLGGVGVGGCGTGGLATALRQHWPLGGTGGPWWSAGHRSYALCCCVPLGRGPHEGTGGREQTRGTCLVWTALPGQPRTGTAR